MSSFPDSTYFVYVNPYLACATYPLSGMYYLIALMTVCTAPSAFSVVLTATPVELTISPPTLELLVLTVTADVEALLKPQIMN